MATVYKQVADLLAKQTFDIIESDGGWPDVNWLIANELLRDYDDFIRHKSIDGLVAQIKNCLGHSIDFCENTLRVNLYRGNTDGGKGKRLEFITPNPEYKRAKEQDYQRMKRGLERKILKCTRDVARRLPEIGAQQLVEEGRLLMENSLSS